MNPNTPLVVVVDDEAAIRRSMEVTLSARGFRVETAEDGETALAIVSRMRPGLIVLDLGLPGISGHTVIEELRCWSDVPILVLSARHEDVDKVRALDAGADDYVTKPFSMDELLARVRANLRRTRRDDPRPEAVGPVVTPDFTVDLVASRVLDRDGAPVHLTPTEWHLVDVLVRNRGRLVPQKALLQEVWGPEYGEESNYLRVFLAQIRAKLEPRPSQPRYFHTETGLGYRFEDRGV